MLSYRHIFHAGNFADVFKHAIVGLLVQALKRKDKPFFYLDTHAGSGRYDLQGSAAQKNREHLYGIARLWARPEASPLLKPYLDAVAALNSPGSLRYYPGSPRLVRHLLRERDRMALCELHSTDYEWLSREFSSDGQVAVHATDGYQALKAFLPPPERRGLVLIDPAFELKDERERLLKALLEAYRRWPTGVYAVWFPILDRDITDAFYRRLRNSGMAKILLAELCVGPETSALGMYGTGMVVINPPWQLDDDLKVLLPQLREILAEPGQGGWRVEWLAGEACAGG